MPLAQLESKEAGWPMMEDSTLAIWEPGMQSPERETSAGMGVNSVPLQSEGTEAQSKEGTTARCHVE